MYTQELNLTESSPSVSEKAQRIELRALKEVYPLTRDIKDLSKIPIRPHSVESKKRVSVFCLGNEINLKKLAVLTKNDSLFSKTILYYGECLYSNVKFNCFSDNADLYSDILFMKYGVLVTWGLSEKQEKILISKITPYILNEYGNKEYEYLHYTILNQGSSSVNSENIQKSADINEEITGNTVKNDEDAKKVDNGASYFSDDIFYLSSNDFFTKMVISNALAQSVKLDYFENGVESLIESTRHLPSTLHTFYKSEGGNMDIMELMGKLFTIKFDINLTSNILDDPELLWYYPDYSCLYEAMKHCLEINTRTDLLNKRCDTMEDLMKLLISRTHNNKDRNYLILLLLIIFGVFLGSFLKDLLTRYMFS